MSEEEDSRTEIPDAEVTNPPDSREGTINISSDEEFQENSKASDAELLDSTSRHNAQLPVSKLNADILVEIFTEYVALIYQGPAEIVPLLRCKLDHITPARVCRFWRNVFYEFAMPWTYVPLWTPLRMIPEHLKRSRTLPLHITVMAFEPTSPASASVGRLPVLKLVFAELPRIRQLEIQILDITLWEDSELLLSGPAPLLQALTIRGPVSYQRRGDWPSALSKGFSGGQAPALENLTVHYMPLRTLDGESVLSTFGLANIRHLSLQYDQGCPPLVSVDDILQILRSMPLLESVDLRFVLPKDLQAADPMELHQIALPHLQQISLRSHMADCANLLTYLDIPPETSIYVCGAVTRPGRYLPSIEKLSVPSVFQHLAILYSSKNSYVSAKLTALSSGIRSGTYPRGEETNVASEPAARSPEIHFQFPPEMDAELEDKFKLIPYIFPASEIVELTLQPSGLSKSTLVSIFDDMPAVQVLRIHNSTSDILAILDAIFIQEEARLKDAAGRRSGRLSLPALQVLELRQCSFPLWCRRDIEVRLRDHAAVLERCGDAGAHLQKVIIEKCEDVNRDFANCFCQIAEAVWYKSS